MCLVGHDIMVYRRRGFWSLGYSYAAKIATERWCEEMYGGGCRIYHEVAIIAAILEDYLLYLRLIILEILTPDQDWQQKVVAQFIKTHFSAYL